MSTYTHYTNVDDVDSGLRSLIQKYAAHMRLDRKRSFVAMIFGALLAFEIFNFSTTEFALTDLLGSLQFAGLRWSTILALAFCGMDFAGIARLFTQEEGEQEPTAIWYLLGAWLLAGAMNAILSWWAISLALLEHQGLGNEVIGRDVLLTIVPIFVALLVWLIRILIIGTFTITGEHIFTRAVVRKSKMRRQMRTEVQSAAPPRRNPSNGVQKPARPAPKPSPTSQPRPANLVRRPLSAQPPRRR